MSREIDEGNMTLGALDDIFNVTAANYDRDRPSVMCDYGLVERLHCCFYRLTDDGCAFLNKELDASTLESSKEPDD